MALKCLVFLAMLKFALSMPDPDPDVNVDVNVDVDAQPDPDPDVNVNVNVDVDAENNEPSDKSCKFGDKVYPDNALTDGTCMQFLCIQGCWYYTEKIDPKCGECQVDGDPHITTYDHHTNRPPGVNPPYAYRFDGNGTFAVTQPGFAQAPQFGVKSEFVHCNGENRSCVAKVSYHEPGITVDLSTPGTQRCHDLSESWCEITVHVNGFPRTIGSKVTPFHTMGGTVVLIFEHLVGDDNLKCINIVGSKGFSVSLCLQGDNFPFSYVWAMPYLKNYEPSLLHGLCDTYTGTQRNYYILRDGSHVAGNTQAQTRQFADSWETTKFPGGI